MRRFATPAAYFLMLCTTPAFAHGGGPGDGTPYEPPPYEEPPPQKHKNVSKKHQHEVWVVDQSNNTGVTWGGKIHIFDGEKLRKNAATAPRETIDLGGTTTALCMAETGANPVRPHMLVFNPEGHTHAILAFVASGHVVVFDATTREPLRCFRTEPGAGGARQAHAIWPSPDEAYILVANQNGKKLERIASNYETNTFVQEPAATLDLANCTTPNGLPCQDPVLRPDNAPICPFIPESGYPAYVSLRGGGMLVYDPYTTPMSIVGEYPAGVIPRDGCGFVEAKGYVYGNGGGGNAANLDGWFIYRLPVGGDDVYNAANPPNTPAMQEIDHDTRTNRDAHGVGRTKNENYVWFFDRGANVVEIFKANSGEKKNVVNLVSPFSADPTPDLAGEAPDGHYMYLSTRGPNPLSGDPHASTGSTPGVLVVEVLKGGKSAAVRGLAPITNVDGAGVERADAHGIRVRLIGKKHGHGGGHDDDDDDDGDCHH